MTLSQIIAQALRQLDEDAEDVSEYEERFRVYANMGYDIAVREYLKPRRIFYTEVDEEGNAPVPGLTVVRVIELRDKKGFDIGFDLDPCGRCFHVWRDDLAGQTLRAVCEVAFYRWRTDRTNRSCRNTRMRRWRTTSAIGTCPAAIWPSRAGRSFIRPAFTRRCSGFGRKAWGA